MKIQVEVKDENKVPEFIPIELNLKVVIDNPREIEDLRSDLDLLRDDKGNLYDSMGNHYSKTLIDIVEQIFKPLFSKKEDTNKTSV